VLTPYETQRLTKNGRVLNIWLTATTLVDKFGEVYAIATTEREIISQ
jgi:two-component system CheB/CheR fusion protein